MVPRILGFGCLLAPLGADAAQQNTCVGRQQAQCAGDCRWDGLACDEICFRPNTAYTPDMQTQPVTRVSSQELCREHCRNIPGCMHFTHYSFTRSCHLQDATASRQQAAGAVSGEPSCGAGGGFVPPAPQPAPQPAARPPWQAPLPSGPVIVHISTTPRWSHHPAPAPAPSWGGGGGSFGAPAQQPQQQQPSWGGEQQQPSGGGGGSFGAPAPPPFFGGDAPNFGAPTESMPGSVGRVMQVGSVQAAARFSGLFARGHKLLRRSSAGERQLACLVGSLASVVCLGVALFALYRRRAGRQAPQDHSEVLLCTAASVVEE